MDSGKPTFGDVHDNCPLLKVIEEMFRISQLLEGLNLSRVKPSWAFNCV